MQCPIRALALEIVTFGMHSDSIHYGLSDLRLSILESGRLGRAEKQFREARDRHIRTLTSEQISRIVGRQGHAGQLAGSPGVEPPRIVIELDEAAVDEFGFTVTQIGDFLSAVRLVGSEVSHGSCALLELVFICRIAETLERDEAYVQGMLQMFVLEPRNAFLCPPQGFALADVYPWRFNRGLSYARRPLIRRSTKAGTEVLWGNRHVDGCWKNFLSLCLTGRLKAQSLKMRQFSGRLRHSQGESFNDSVADLARDELGLRVERRVKKLGQFRLQNLGDIDILAADKHRKVLKVIECKDLSAARTPHELANEVKALLNDRPGDPSIVTRHQKRVQWVREHINDAIDFMGLVPDRRWTVESVLVVDEPLLTAQFEDCPARIISFTQFRSERSER